MKTMLRAMLAALVMVVGVGWSSHAFAWGDSGHRTVCEIALRNLTPAARREVDRLLRAHPVIPVVAPRNAEYGWACTYPDNIVRGGPDRRSSEHYVNYPRTTLVVTRGLLCGAVRDCVISAIATDLATLRSTSAADSRRAEALIYLGHWIGDIHQPLHSSFKDDTGGNEVNVRELCRGGLHSTWDTCILESRHLGRDPSVESVRALATAWDRRATEAERRAWRAAEPWQWLAESYVETLKPELGYCILAQGACRYSADHLTWAPRRPRRSVLIDSDYMDMAMPIIRRRIAQAGVRLAHYLNQALDPAYRG